MIRPRTTRTVAVAPCATSEKVPGFEEILVPGERGLRQRDESLEKGALIYESVWENTARLAREYGVSMPV